ncbi:2-dehydropantoate 2-reductase [Mesorhizobium sp. M1C.F.Ca.ET.193.01.1.1]|uniref:2-dehydropantoate 2-reductase n=1 Tax=unclassified Mesorhizobium TaxID=325217 RepID=UPI000FD1A4CE|nr:MULTISPECIES: 2-dehydropantoate 2-reductase [unclassified Mesorhizobium]TGT01993.1 2-dehydropantoate 2-reductase [bacterium M00.F.Ca.ET.177.01.1.1]TGQ54843.1 2-dehydropantoate 2-reductase [Mesorhizobium sp. M1C.F.Ca.ET.210.01.1.1]TGQ73622.1 2-dehydropantoate 2-reductase [Mesorhizobium sp. M1C.F.Ca.ET.212.01.1.1]TGR11072.1 2-dehydropantoate 2-reductase [Mesorhizobium sp. M1C.F.Ca.ET.204.01.1.1]TGR31656.1 2-dehydropantoate 2-reductase [Mesorhizobium sp. M1C.F.Ca.ET.196.01.1.1]
MANAEKTIAVAGAGSIGCYVGGCLALAGRKVNFLGRGRIVEAMRKDGLRVSDLDGRDRRIEPEALAVTDDPVMALRNADIILVTVKSGATGEMATLVATHARPDAIVVSLQNGVDNADKLRVALPARRVLAGMVAFNVVQSPDGEIPFSVRRASDGMVMIEDTVPGLAALLNVEGLGVETHADMKAVQWSKLLMNLNNALVALSNLPLAAELADRSWRVILAGQIEEALAAMKAAGIEPARIAGPPPWLLPKVLRLPDWLFGLLARRLLAIDPRARGSMWDDLKRGRPTEIDELQGAILRLAEKTGVPVPQTRRVAALVRQAETEKRGPPGLTPDAVSGGPRSA